MSSVNNTAYVANINFTVSVLTFSEIYNRLGRKIDELIGVSINVKDCDDESSPFTISRSILDTFDWVAHDHRCVLPPTNQGKIKRILASEIRSKLPKPDKIYVINKTGLYEIENELIFCTGSGIIRSTTLKENAPIIKAENCLQRLDFDSSLPKRSVIIETLNLAGLSPEAGRLILVYNLMWVMRAAYAAAWKQPEFCLFLHAETSSMKTTFAQLLTLYGGNHSPPQLSSTYASSMGIIKSKSDCVTIFDDLYPTEDKTLWKKLMDTFSKVTRDIGNSKFSSKMDGKEVDGGIPTSGVIFTGEKKAGEGSTAARLLLANVKVVDEKELDLFQQNPTIVGNFYHTFIEWYLSKYNKIVEYLKDSWYNYYSKIDLGVLRRLRQTIYHLSTSHMILMEFCVENDIFSLDKAKHYQQSFAEITQALILEQNKRARPVDEIKEKTATTDYFAGIRAMYKNRDFRLAANPKEFTESYDGFVHDSCLCLYSNRFNQETRKTIFKGASIGDIWDSVESQGALRRSKEGKRSTQIACRGKTPHFYKIPLEKLV